MIRTLLEKKYAVIALAAALAIIALGTWYFTSQRRPERNATQKTQQPEIPIPILASITAKPDDTLTVMPQTATTTRDIRLDISTQIFKDGKPIKAIALKKGMMVAIVLYPADIGADNIAHTITIVSSE